MSMPQQLVSEQMSRLRVAASGIIKSLGIVFGDIGTSPLYTFTTIFGILMIPRTQANIFGVVSLIIWTLVLVVTVQYAWLAMSLGRKGEGGIIALKELLVPMLKNPRQAMGITLLSFVGFSLFIGDGIITPAVTILSAVEGLLLIPGCAGLGSSSLTLIAALICIGLFVFQSRGTEKVGSAFGPIMLIWFSSLLIFGALAIGLHPSVLQAVNPAYALAFLWAHGFLSFFVLSAVILCATGGEALYADMGHLGRKPITRAWVFVFISLVSCYLGQAAFLLYAPGSKQIFLEMVFSFLPSILHVPFLILVIMATAIASQALISAIFSLVYQGIAIHMLPMVRVEYTSSKLRSQVYIGFVNWVLLCFVLFMIFNFKTSENLVSAYGMVVTGDMMITSIMMTMIYYLRKRYLRSSIAAFLIFINGMFLSAALLKLPDGAYWSLLIALIPLSIILIYTYGQRRLYGLQKPMPMDAFLERYTLAYKGLRKLKGSALFFVRDLNAMQAYVVQTMFEKHIIYEENIIISVVTCDNPFGITGRFKGDLAEGLRIFEIRRGYMELLDIDRVLHSAAIDPQVIFYGLEAIMTKNVIWKIYAAIKLLSPTFVQFYRLPPDKLHGIVSLVEM